MYLGLDHSDTSGVFGSLHSTSVPVKVDDELEDEDQVLVNKFARSAVGVSASFVLLVRANTQASGAATFVLLLVS
jgi:hypothetical protein